MKKKKMLVFHSALAPYRIDQFNALAELFELEIVFYLDNLPRFKYDQEYLKNQCNFKISYLINGIGTKDRFLRFGVLKKIRKSNPNFILSYEYSATTHYLLLLKKLKLISQKVGTMVDDSLDICYNPRSKARYYSRKMALKELDFIVLLSETVSEYYKQNLNMRADQIIVSPLLQLPERLRNAHNELKTNAKSYIEQFSLYGKKVLLYVGRFAPEKALPAFISNISQILKDDDNLLLVMVGDGDEANLIKEIIDKNQLNKKVIFPGRYEGNELLAWYLCASGLFLSSISETYGAVVNESLIFGTKVLCSDLAGASAIITERNGLIFNPLNKKETFEKANLFISDMTPVTEIDLEKSVPIMEVHPNDYLHEWKKIM